MEEDKVHPLSNPIAVHIDYSLDIRKWRFPNKIPAMGIADFLVVRAC